MKKSKKQAFLKRTLVYSSVLIIISPMVTQTMSISASAETINASVTEESTHESANTLSLQQEIEKSATTESETVEDLSENEKSEESPDDDIESSSNITGSNDLTDIQNSQSSSINDVSEEVLQPANQMETNQKADASGVSEIRVHYVDSNGNDLLPVRSHTSMVGDVGQPTALSTVPLYVPGYEYKSVNVANSGTDGRVTVPFPAADEVTDIFYVYVPIPQNILINFIDDDENVVVKSVSLDGIFNEVTGYTTAEDIASLKESGYVLVSDQTAGINLTFGLTSPTIYEVHMKHGIVEADETRTVERTIHYVYQEDGSKAAEEKKEALTFTRKTIKDLVTNDIQYSDWIAKDDDDTFDRVDSPKIEHYTADREYVDGVTGITGDSEDIVEIVKYKANMVESTETKEVKQTIHYVYEDGKEAAADKVDTVSFTRTVTTNEATGVETYGEWQAKDNDTTFDAVTSPTIDKYHADKEKVEEVTGLTAESKDSEVTVTYTPNMVESTETKEVKQTIHYLYEDGKEAAPDNVDTVTFERTVITNEATGDKNYGEWQAKDNDTTFDAVISPEIANYTPDQMGVAEMVDLTAESKDSEVTVLYKPKMETTTESKEVNLTVHYVFSDGSKAADDYVDTVTFTRNATKNLTTGVVTYDEWTATNNDTTFDEVNSPTITMYTPDKTSVEEVTSITADSKNIEVTVTYKQNPMASVEMKEVKRVIHYVYEDGTAAAVDKVDKVTFTRTVVQDFENDEVTYGDWLPKDNDTTFDAETSPEIEHYTADKATVEEVTGLTAESKDSEVTVTYKANMVESTETKEVKQTIHYLYEDGTEAAPDKVDTVTFTRTVTTNEATGEKNYGEWEAKDGDTTFDAVESAEIEGYTADLETVKERTGLTATDKDSEVTVTYTKKATEPLTGPSTEPSEIPEESDEPAAKTAKTTNEKKLPQTGEETSSSAIYGGVALIAAALLGVFFKRTRRNAKK